MRTWAEWDDARPGFVEIDLVGQEGGNSRGEFCFTLDITDIATGWTDTVSVKNKAQKWVFAAIKEATAKFPFPILGIDSDNGSEFIKRKLFRWCEQENLTFTRSRSGNKSRRCPRRAEELAYRAPDGRLYRYDTAGELVLLNRIWALQRLLTNHFAPQQKLVSKESNGAKTTKKYDKPATPYQHVLADTGAVTKSVKTRLNQGKRAAELGGHPTSGPGPHGRTADPHHIKTRTKSKSVRPGKINDSTNQSKRAS